MVVCGCDVEEEEIWIEVWREMRDFSREVKVFFFGYRSKEV